MDELMNSDSDDDLVAPDFLKKADVTLSILSPRRAIRPNCETLSPLPDLGSEKKLERSCKAKISLASLLTEKIKDDVVQKNADNITELKEKFQNEDYMALVSNDLDCSQDCSQMSNVSNDYEDSQDILQRQNSVEKDQFENNNDEEDKENKIPLPKRFIHDFPDTFPGEKYFTQYRPAEDLKAILKGLYMDIMNCDEFDADRDIDCEDENLLLHTILQSLIPLIRELTISTCKRLWQVLCFCQDYQTSQTALQILTNYLLCKNSSIDWVPEVDDFILALSKCGADFDVLLPNSIAKSMGKCLPAIHVDIIDIPISPKSVRKCFYSRLHNFQAIIKLLTVSIQNNPKKYTPVDLSCLLILVMRLTVERVVQYTLSDINTLIGSILDIPDSNIWPQVMKNNLEMLLSFKMHHRNLLQLIGTILPSQRGTEFKQMLAFNTATSLINKTDSFHALPIKIVDTFNLISSIRIVDETDYFELYSILSLIGMCINTDDVTSGQKANLTKVREKLHLLHGEIKEYKGAYLDRTKVKNVILRMVTKFKFVAQSVQTQSKLDSYFDSMSFTVPVETISSEMTDGSQDVVEEESQETQ